MRFAARLASLVVALSGGFFPVTLPAASGWLNWRGPEQNGVSTAKQALPTSLELGGPTIAGPTRRMAPARR
jgi:hypothetical protein